MISAFRAAEISNKNCEELGYEVVLRKADGGFTNESYIRW